MAYLGRNPAVGTQRMLDSLESQFNGVLTTFDLRYGGVPTYPTLSSSLIVSLGGVLQEPGVAYYVSSDSIVFSEPPLTGAQCWILLYSQYGTGVGAAQQGTLGAETLVLTGQLQGPSIFVIDPATVGDDTGLVRIKGDLEVLGATTNINSTTLVIEDKNIILGDTSSPTDASADGGGITLKGGSDKTLTWVDGTDAWTSSERFSVPLGTAGAPSLTFTGDPNTGIYSPGADQVAISTNGTGRLFVDASGNVGAGTASPSSYWEQSRNLVVGGPSHVGITLASAGTGNNNVIAFADSTTGTPGFGNGGSIIYSHNTNVMQFRTAGSERMRLDSSGRVGIGTTSPGYTLDVNGSASVVNLYKDSFYNAAFTVGNRANQPLILTTNDTERARIDSSGRLLVGTSSARSNFTNRTDVAPALQVEGLATALGDKAISIVSSSSVISRGAHLYMSHQLSGTIGGNTVLGNNNQIGLISFNGSDGSEFVEAATIGAFTDGTPGTDDMPGRLVFSTTADGESSPTERLRINNTGQVLVNSVGSASAPVITKLDDTNTGIFFPAADTIAFAEGGIEAARIDSSGRLLVGTSTASTTATAVFQGNSGGSTSHAIINLARGVTNPGINLSLGFAQFQDSAGSVGAQIYAQTDVAWSAGSYAGRLVFSTTADGASSPTERMRIDSGGRVLIGQTGIQQYNNFSNDLSLQISRGGGLNANIQIGSFRNDNFGGGIILSKSRSSTVGTNTIVQVNDSLGNYAFFGADGTNWIRAASIEALVDGTPGTNDMPGRLVFSTTADGASTPTERMRITSGGNVGIGTTNPQGTLGVFGSISIDTSSSSIPSNGGVSRLSNNYTYFAGRSTGAGAILNNGDGTATVRVESPGGSTGQIIMESGNGSERLRITSTGNVGIGTTNPSDKLHTYSPTVVYNSIESGAATNAGVRLKNTLSDWYIINDSNGELQFYRSDIRLLIDSAGNVGIGTNDPQYKLEVNGSFAATTKSFVIDHPTKPGYRLRHGSLEGPENGVYVRGRSTDPIIHLPDYWVALVDADSITITLTPIGSSGAPRVERIENNKVYIFSEDSRPLDYFYMVNAERVDVAPLEVEIPPTN